MDIDEHEKSTSDAVTASGNDTQNLDDDGLSATSKTNNATNDPDSKRMATTDVNEKDIKTAAASTLAAAAVKAKVCLLTIVLIEFESIFARYFSI